MQLQTFAKDYIDLQKRSYHNLFDALTVFQNCAQQAGNYWFHHLDVDKDAWESLQRWHAAWKQKRDASRKWMDSRYATLEKYVSGLGH